MSFFKKFSKLDDIAFHLVHNLNKKKLKLNLLLSKDWEKITGANFYNTTKIRQLTYDQKADSCSVEITCDPSIVLELRSQLTEITLRIEQALGIKVKKVSFFQDIFENQIEKKLNDYQIENIPSKNVNKIELNDIKDNETSLIFERINRSIKNENK